MLVVWRLVVVWYHTSFLFFFFVINDITESGFTSIVTNVVVKLTNVEEKWRSIICRINFQFRAISKVNSINLNLLQCYLDIFQSSTLTTISEVSWHFSIIIIKFAVPMQKLYVVYFKGIALFMANLPEDGIINIYYSSHLKKPEINY